jgi:putative transposase
MITRYVEGGENRFRPDPETENGIGFLLAVYADRHGVELNAACYPGNHEHLLGCDVNGKMPLFTQNLHARLTQHLNETFGDTGTMWDKRQTNHVRMINPEDTADRFAYVCANPVKHQFVEHAEDFPGFKMQWLDPPRTFTRPKWLDPKKFPEKATLTMHRPRGFEDMSDAELEAHLGKLIAEKEKDFRDEVIAAGGTFMGAAKVKRQSRHRRPSRKSRRKRRRRRGQVIPTIAARDRETRKEVLEDDRRWRAKYVDRLQRWRRGERDVVFPYGTYKMLHVHQVAVAPPPT